MDDERFFMGDGGVSSERAHALLDECLSLLSALQQPPRSTSDAGAKQDREDRISMRLELIQKVRRLASGITRNHMADAEGQRKSPETSPIMLTEENLLTFGDAAKTLPCFNDRPVSPSTLWRWATKGIKGVRLESRRFGMRFYTSVEALDRFSERLAAVDGLCP